MILVDTSVWVGHFRQGDPRLVEALEGGDVLGHAWVTGELALGNLPDRAATVKLLRNLPQASLGTAAGMGIAGSRGVGRGARVAWQAWAPCPNRPPPSSRRRPS